jgi:CRP-like cAMP-binding protein
MLQLQPKELAEIINKLDIIKRSPLFTDIAEQDLASLLNCLDAKEREYAKNDYIFLAGNKAEQVGIVLSGQVHVVQEDFWGNRTILAHISPGSLFGEAFACAQISHLLFSVIAVEKSTIMLINYRKIVSTCPTACLFHSQIIRNMLGVVARNNILLTQKIEHISKRSLREKLQSYLSWQAVLHQGPSFNIPFSRQELADYLCVDRSALSRELSAMQEEGLLSYHKNSFELSHWEQ